VSRRIAKNVLALDDAVADGAYKRRRSECRKLVTK
jgi:hypothetical protein